MYKAFINRFKLALITGFLVVTPILLLLFVFTWAIESFAALTQPAIAYFTTLGFSYTASITLSIVTLIAVCLATGVLLATKIGKAAHSLYEWIAEKLPGYKFIRETLKTLLDPSKFSLTDKRVCLFKPYGAKGAEAIGFVMDEAWSQAELNDKCCIYVPTAPVPTSGLIFFIPKSEVQVLEHVSASDALRLVTLCGADALKVIGGNDG
ncbi:DUF502 domain-containing protein [Vibrio breoganii]